MTHMTTRTHHTPTYYRVRTLVRCAFLAGVAMSAFLFGRALAHDPHTFECDGTQAVAVLGDTLWSLAEKHCSGHIGSAVDTLHATYGDLSYGETVSLDIGRG